MTIDWAQTALTRRATVAGSARAAACDDIAEAAEALMKYEGKYPAAYLVPRMA